jgi:vacuolar-type H+-ATPase subunit I/STV1
MVREELVKKCIDLAKQLKTECSQLFEELKGSCAIRFAEFFTNFIKLNQNGSECFRTFEQALKEEDREEKVKLLRKARTFCNIAIESGKEAKDRIRDLEEGLCILTGIEMHKRKIDEDIKKLEEKREEIEKEIRKILWKG